VDLDRIEKAVEAAIAELLEKGVTADEVARAKQVLIDRAAFAHDNLRTGAMSFGVALTTGRKVADVEAWPEHIGKVTPEEALAAARHVLKDTGSVTAILLGTDKKTTARKAAVAPGSEPNDAPDGVDGPDGPGEAPGAGQPN
jgi:zinc protease